MNVNKAKTIAQKTEYQYRKNITEVNWTDVYNSEAEIIEDLKKVHIPGHKEEYLILGLYNGFQYIHSFAQRVQAGKELTEKQLLQCKRLAVEIKKAANISEAWND